MASSLIMVTAVSGTVLRKKWVGGARHDQPNATDELALALQKLPDPRDRNNWHLDGDFFLPFSGLN